MSANCITGAYFFYMDIIVRQERVWFIPDTDHEKALAYTQNHEPHYEETVSTPVEPPCVTCGN